MPVFHLLRLAHSWLCKHDGVIPDAWCAGRLFDYSDQDGQWNITPDNDRSYMLTLIGQSNPEAVLAEFT
jgi:hypothetical protein